MLNLTRRSALLGLSTAFTTGGVSLALADAPTDRRFVVVLLRGALDGMSAVVPYGDRDLIGLRAELLPAAPGQPGGLLDLGGFFGMHPSLTNVHGMYKSGEALVVHAVAGPYRVRSHFEAQDYMESGADRRLTSGWLNRAVATMPGASSYRPEGNALAIGVAVPLLLRGSAMVGNWAPHGNFEPPASLYQEIAALNRPDHVIGPAIAEGLRARDFSASVMAGETDPDPRKRYAFPALARAGGELLRAADGPRIAALEIYGWDTHVAQTPRLDRVLKQLDGGMQGLKEGLGPAWEQTAVLLMTEFGRTARVNGTQGTDHGTASVAFVLGGAVAGGRVAGQWPGLRAGQLFENRDLAPTTDVRSVAKGLLTDHLGLQEAVLASVFPGSGPAAPIGGLVHV
jgi:uncharacterized protein (DUF1501 family)